jgi:hypothetical protein
MGADGCRGALFELDKHKIFESDAFLFVLDGGACPTKARASNSGWPMPPQGAKRYAEAFSKDRDGAGHGPYRYSYYANRL